MTIKPLADRLVVEPISSESITPSGIIIPDSVKEKPNKGKVIAVGAGKGNELMTCKEGDTVLYGKHAGTEIEIDKKKYLIMRESDVFAII